jgi:multidrug efflux pump subunit AcrA (membrane-fusion protein)
MMRFIFCLGAAAGILLSSCSEKSSGSNDGKSATFGGGARVPMEIQGVGTAQAYSFVSIRSQITDKIVQAHFREGQEVKAGDMRMGDTPQPLSIAFNASTVNVGRNL